MTTLLPKSKPLSPKLAGVAEAAELLGVSRAAISSARRREPRRRSSRPQIGQAFYAPFPEPIAELACGPIWTIDQLKAFSVENKRVAKQTPADWLKELRGDRASPGARPPRTRSRSRPR